MLLSHGFGDNGLSWWYLFAELTDQFELISVEARVGLYPIVTL